MHCRDFRSCGTRPRNAVKSVKSVYLKASRMWVGRLLRACLMTLGFVAAATATESAFAQANFDRPGGDYMNVVVPSGDPAECALLCERDRRCRAWSFNYPSNISRNALCWLKNSVPASDTATKASPALPAPVSSIRWDSPVVPAPEAFVMRCTVRVVPPAVWSGCSGGSPSADGPPSGGAVSSGAGCSKRGRRRARGAAASADAGR